MRAKSNLLPISAFTLLALYGGQQVQAGGLMLYEIGTDNTGLANAGAAARAQGPSTIASNPAGLSYLEGTQITAGAQVLYGDMTFDTNADTNTAGSSSDNIIDPMPAGNFFISHSLDDKWSVGFGSYGDFGLKVKYRNNWSGRYFAQDGKLLGLSLVPSTAYRINDEWSVGFGLEAMYAMLQAQTAINRAPFGLTNRADGQYKYQDDTWGYGSHAGVIYMPQPGTRVGLAYTSQINLDFEDRLDVKGTGPALNRLDSAKTQLQASVPQTATLSLYQQLNPQWAGLASVNWQDWSQFGDINLDVNTALGRSTSTTIHASYIDTYQLALGAQYQATPEWLWNAGIAYDTSAVSNKNRTFVAPIDSTLRLGTGATYAMDKNTDVNVSWSIACMGDVSVDQSKSLSGNRTSGQFNDAWIQTITANMTWRF